MAESPGFTRLGAPSCPGFPASPLPGQCINSQPWLRALTQRVAPLMRGRPGRRRPRACATGLSPVGPPWASAEAAPPRGWGVAQCATTALADAVPRPCVRGARGRPGGSGRYLVLCLSRFPHPAPRVPRCVWRAVLSGCPLPSLAGTPFHAVCAFRVLGPVALLVVPAPPFACVCARAPAASAPPPPLGGVACAPRAVPALGAGRAVPRGPCPSACPAPVPCSIWRAWGGAVRSRFPPTWLGAVVVRGVWCQTLPLPRPPAHWAGCWGPLPTCCGRGCVAVGAQHCPLGLHALWGLRAAGVVWWGAVPGGRVACHCCEGRLVSGAVPPQTARSLGRAAGVPRPVCSGCGRCGRGDPAPVPQRAPLRAGAAGCAGGGRASPGGVPSTVVRGV